ncbi:hypothetical protein OH807_41010 [Kitasatospora sp. NBC_01560]|uniref:hypothetical protein n=1 Tax=Kitasatospora sp. NBC_01560 TaxID=2975965 RepID=UPI00386AEFAB
MRKRVVASVGAFVLVGGVATAHAAGVHVAPDGGTVTCYVSPGQWKALADRGVGFRAMAPGVQLGDREQPGTTLTDPGGRLDVLGRGQITFRGGFRLESRATGDFVEVTEPRTALPAGNPEFQVRSSFDPVGTRMEILEYAVDPTALHLSLLGLTLGIDATDIAVNPTFAAVLTRAFGDGASETGMTFAACSADLTVRLTA